MVEEGTAVADLSALQAGQHVSFRSRHMSHQGHVIRADARGAYIAYTYAGEKMQAYITAGQLASGEVKVYAIAA